MVHGARGHWSSPGDRRDGVVGRSFDIHRQHGACFGKEARAQFTAARDNPAHNTVYLRFGIVSRRTGRRDAHSD